MGKPDITAAYYIFDPKVAVRFFAACCYISGGSVPWAEVKKQVYSIIHSEYGA